MKEDTHSQPNINLANIKNWTVKGGFTGDMSHVTRKATFTSHTHMITMLVEINLAQLTI